MIYANKVAFSAVVLIGEFNQLWDKECIKKEKEEGGRKATIQSS